MARPLFGAPPHRATQAAGRHGQLVCPRAAPRGMRAGAADRHSGGWNAHVALSRPVQGGQLLADAAVG
eukprot:7548894-Alexandrium_andersonii.AAC.1